MKAGILLAAFGVSSAQGGQTLKGMEERVRTSFPGLPVRWAFTSPLMRERLAGQWKKSDSVEKALQKMAFERFERVAVQPLYVVAGMEYAEVLDETSRVQSSFNCLRTGAPLLDVNADLNRAAQALASSLPAERSSNEVVLCMGHGSQHPSQTRYTELAKAMEAHMSGVFMATMKGETRLDHILPKLDALAAQGWSRKVWLVPLLSLVGRHALEDMAGNAPDSWRSRLAVAGYEALPVLHGLVEYPAFAALWLERLAVAVRDLES